MIYALPPQPRLLPLLKKSDAPSEPRKVSTQYLRKCHGVWSATDHSQGLQLSVTETTQMHAGIRHGFMQSAEALLPVFCLLFLLQTLKLHDLPRMLLSVVRRHIRWQ